MQFNMMHILPSSKIPFPKIPMDVMIKNKVNFTKKRDKKLNQGTGDLTAINGHEPVHGEREDEAEENELFMLDEFPFENAVCLMEEGAFTVDELKMGYKKLANFLGFDENQDCGFTLIVAPQWMFMCPIYQPYHLESQIDIFGADLEGGVPLYHDGFAYAGILNIQDMQQQWPETSGIGNKQHTALESLTLQSTPKEIIE